MRGLAKMRELDLRLARITERARDFKRISLGEAEEAKKVASIPEVSQVIPTDNLPYLFSGNPFGKSKDIFECGHLVATRTEPGVPNNA